MQRLITIFPHRGAGKITSGMTRRQVEEAVGAPPRRRMKLSKFELSEIDFFDGFAVYYDENDKSCAIEFSRGGVGVEYDGYELFAHPAGDVRAWARARPGHGNKKRIHFTETGPEHVRAVYR